MSRRDRPKVPTMRVWLVKLRGAAEPIEVEAEYRGAARYYARCVTPVPMYGRAAYRAIEWARLKRP